MPRKLMNWKLCENRLGLPIKEILYQLHWEKNLPVRNGMDNELGFCPYTISKWMKELGVKTRSISEDNKRRYSLMTETEIKTQTLAANEVVRKNGQPKNIGRPGWCTGLTKKDHPGLMISSLKHMGKNNPMYGKRGAAHHNWTGGYKHWKHKEWNEIRKKIKERDNYICQECGKKEQDSIIQCGQPLQVHHIIPYRISKNHNVDNLITLCSSCHSKADGNIGEGKWKPKE